MILKVAEKIYKNTVNDLLGFFKLILAKNTQSRFFNYTLSRKIGFINILGRASVKGIWM